MKISTTIKKKILLFLLSIFNALIIILRIKRLDYLLMITTHLTVILYLAPYDLITLTLSITAEGLCIHGQVFIIRNLEFIF